MNDQERAAMQQALEALEHHGGRLPWITFVEVLNALKAALAQQPEPVQEPVAWALHTGTRQGIKWNREVEHGTPLYTAPPQRPPLTDEEMRKLWSQYGYKSALCMRFARAVERKVRGEA